MGGAFSKKLAKRGDRDPRVLDKQNRRLSVSGVAHASPLSDSNTVRNFVHLESELQIS